MRPTRTPLIALLAALILGWSALLTPVHAAEEAEGEETGQVAEPAQEGTSESDDSEAETGETASRSAQEKSPADDETAEEETTEEETTDEETGEPGIEIADAQFRWGINHESNRAGFAPGTFNLLSAGKLGNPGAGGHVLYADNGGATWHPYGQPSASGPTAGWAARSGNVTIEKYLESQGGYTTATWAGTRTGRDGATTSTPGNGVTTDHQVVIDGGSGEIDPENGSATIAWEGDFTVVYYSGMTFFYVSDPVLRVEDGRGKITATLSGYASDMQNMSTWEAIAPRTATLADLGAVDLTGEDGFTVTPAYREVSVTVPSGIVSQVRNGSHWGSFPQSFVDFQVIAGAAPYWYSSGGGADAYKPTLPLTISYDAAAPIDTEPPATPKPAPQVTNPMTNAPGGLGGPPGLNQLAGPPGLDDAIPGLTAPDDQADGLLTFGTPGSAAMLIGASQEDNRTGWVWWLGSALLFLGALACAAPALYGATSRRPSG